MFSVVSWNYKGYACKIEPEFQDDCVKAWHSVVTPDGDYLIADLTPYDFSQEIVEAWIDAGCPDRQGSCPLHLADLR
jgi:hypothetical protein